MLTPSECAYSAVLQAYYRRTQQEGHDLCVVNLGHSATFLYIYRGGHFASRREIEVGMSDLEHLVADQCSVDVHVAHEYVRQNYNHVLESEQARELYGRIAVEVVKAVNFFNYNNRERELTQLCLCGGGSAIQPLYDTIADTTRHDAAHLRRAAGPADVHRGAVDVPAGHRRRGSWHQGGPAIMAEKMKKGPSEAGRKTLKCPHKQGINLNMREQKGNPRLTLLVGCLAIVILAGCVAKFGVIDQYRRLDAAQAAYASVHTEYTQMQELLKGYDRLLMEYRTYSMEWATDGSEDNGTLVDRQKALDLLEQEMLSRGRLVSLQVSGNKMVVAMSGMSLDQISRMFDVIQQSPIVSNVELNLASTEDGNVSTILDFTVRITLRSAEEADK